LTNPFFVKFNQKFVKNQYFSSNSQYFRLKFAKISDSQENSSRKMSNKQQISHRKMYNFIETSPRKVYIS